MALDVSIIVPTYNRWPLLEEAVGSAAAALHHSGAAGEILVVDDASTDETPSQLARCSFNVRVIRFLQNQGRAVARNAGLAEARGEFVKFLDSDDRLETGSLAAELESGSREASDIVIAGWGEVELGDDGVEIDSSRRTFPPPDMRPLPDALLRGSAVPTSAALYRRSHVRGSLWDPEAGNLDDWLWFCQAAWAAARLSRIEGVAYWVRAHRRPRVTTRLAPLDWARSFYYVLDWMARRLREDNSLTPDRARRLAQYYYKELRVLCLYDHPRYEEVAGLILSLDPGFAPRDEERQAFFRVAGRVLGFRSAIELHCFAKRALSRLRMIHRIRAGSGAL